MNASGIGVLPGMIVGVLGVVGAFDGLHPRRGSRANSVNGIDGGRSDGIGLLRDHRLVDFITGEDGTHGGALLVSEPWVDLAYGKRNPVVAHPVRGTGTH